MADSNFDREALERMLAPTIQAVEKDITRISQSHAGRPVDEVEAELAASMRQRGIEPGPDLREIAQKISDEDPSE